MNDIICPNCKKAFKVDEAGFADILKQVRDHQFDEELQKRLTLAERDKENAVKLAEANLKNILQEDLAKKDKVILELRAQNERELSLQLAMKEAEIAEICFIRIIMQTAEQKENKKLNGSSIDLNTGLLNFKIKSCKNTIDRGNNIRAITVDICIFLISLFKMK